MRNISIIKGFCIYFLSLTISLFIGYIFFNDNLPEVYSTFITSSITILLILWIGHAHIDSIKTAFIDFKTKFRFKEIIFLLVINIIFSLGASLLIGGFALHYSPNIFLEITSQEVISYNGTLQFFTMAISASFIIPISEELFFRRIFFSNLNKKYKFITAALITSLIFGVLHITLASIGALLFGFVACFLYKKYKNILIPISLHVLNNLCASILDGYNYFFTESSTTNSLNVDEILPYINELSSSFLIIGCFIMLVCGGFLLLYFRKNKYVFSE